MFTIRVNGSNGRSRVLSCESYEVEKSTDGLRATVTVCGADGKKPVELVLADGSTAFVMNEQGNTVDRIATQGRPGAEGGTVQLRTT